MGPWPDDGTRAIRGSRTSGAPSPPHGKKLAVRLCGPPRSDTTAGRRCEPAHLLRVHMDEAKHGRRPPGLEARRRPRPRAGMTQSLHSRALSTRTRHRLCATRVARRSRRRPRRHPPLAYSQQTSAQRREAAPPSLRGDSDVPGHEAVPPPAPWAHHIRSSRSRGSHDGAIAVARRRTA